MVLDLKTELQKAQEALVVAKEAIKAAKVATYEHGVMETEARLTAEVMVVCKNYCAETYNIALDRAGVPSDSDLRRVDKVYYPEDIREDSSALPPPTALPFPPPKQPLTTQDLFQGIEIPTGVQKEKRGDVGVSRPDEKAKGKGVQPPADVNPSEDALTIEDMVSKAKAAESKSRADSKKDSHQSKTQI